MYQKCNVVVFLFCLILFTSCQKNTSQANGEVSKWTGVLEKTGMTTYQYGTHTLTGNASTTGNQTENILYALRSATVDLDQYVGKKVTVSGDEIEGYPVDMRPVFIEVTALEVE
ncbi:hypothetical protein [Pararhodonellum marinum]|uniref:hypothetical protein n=1 Tax=Pararhodonellum marinum TaxID=2755358 RepID=UPI00188E691E|nr:hypothetical protein [Pararhodonellum marinum]